MTNSPGLAVIPLNCGQLQFIRSCFSGKPQDAVLELPVFSFLIIHPGGLLLFDTGLPPPLWSGPSALELIPGLTARRGNSGGLIREIEKQGYVPEDISWVVNSHNHPDHAGGNSLITRAHYIMQGRKEWIKEDYDLFKDGSILLLPTPGHSSDHLSMLIRGGNKQVLLTGDACFRPHNLKDGNLPLILEDREEAIKSLERLRSISNVRETMVLTSHDPLAVGEKISLD